MNVTQTKTDHAAGSPPLQGVTKVLLVEDSLSDARLTQDMLCEAGVTNLGLTHVTKLSSALRRISREHFDAILLDLSLLDAHGLQTLTQLQAAIPRIPVVVLTGLQDEALALQAMQHGAQDYLIKGRITGDAIARVIRYAIERKRLELQLALAVEDLKHNNRELGKALDEGVEAARLKSDFLANLSHKLRTPMNGVIGMIDLLLATDLTLDQRQFAEAVQKSGEALRTVIDEMLELSMIEKGKLALESIQFDIRTAFEEVLAVWTEPALRKGVNLVGLVTGSVPTTLLGDPGGLRQILTYLVGNAIKFTEQGEVIVQVGPREETAEDVTLRFDVSGTAIGLTCEEQARLFDPSNQPNDSTTKQWGTTGLGLAIAKRLAEQMGGKIGVNSDPGGGSRFWFTARLGKQPPRPQSRIAPRPNLRDLRVCIVDDSSDNRTLLEHYTTSWGMRPACVEDGQQALALLRAASAKGEGYELALLDMQMPGMGGVELAQTIRTDPELAGLRLVLLTSLGRRGDAQLAREAGVAAYLTKPIHHTQLYDCLSLVMGATIDNTGISTSDAATLITTHSLAEAQAQSRVRVLVVDDEIGSQKAAVRMLAELRHRADVAANGREALEALARVPYDLVLMDCQMPEMDGFDASAEIHRCQGTPHPTPLIAMTTNALSADQDRWLKAGMSDYVSKPMTREELEDVLTRWIPKLRGSSREAEPAQRGEQKAGRPPV